MIVPSNVFATLAKSNIRSLACPSCLIHGVHKGHDVSAIAQAAEDLMNFITDNVEKDVFSVRGVRNDLLNIKHCALSIENELSELKEHVKTLAQRLYAIVKEAEEKAIETAEHQAIDALEKCKKFSKLMQKQDDKINGALAACDSYVQKETADIEFLKIAGWVRKLEEELKSTKSDRIVNTYSRVQISLDGDASGNSDDTEKLISTLKNCVVLREKKKWTFKA